MWHDRGVFLREREGVCICKCACIYTYVYVEFGYVLRTTDYGYRQHEREHENLVEQPGTLGLKLTGATPAGAHGHSAHPWPHCAVHDRSYPTTDITDLTLCTLFPGTSRL